MTKKSQKNHVSPKLLLGEKCEKNERKNRKNSKKNLIIINHLITLDQKTNDGLVPSLAGADGGGPPPPMLPVVVPLLPTESGAFWKKMKLFYLKITIKIFLNNLKNIF